MRIAIAQIEPVKGNIEKNLENHIKWIQQAIENKADLLVFPELSLTGYEPELADSLASNQDDQQLDPLQSLCDENKIAIGVGMPTRKDNDLFISMILLRPEMERITYSKQYLHNTELSVFTAGNKPLVLEMDDEVVAPAICFELSNQEHHEFAANNDATIYVASVLNSVGGVDADLEKLKQVAQKYQMVTLMANFIGTSGGYDCAGKSSVWNEKGELVAQLGDREEGIIVYDTISKEVTNKMSITS